MPSLAEYIQSAQPSTVTANLAVIEEGGPTLSVQGENEPVDDAVTPVTQAVTPVAQAVHPVPGSGEAQSAAPVNTQESAEAQSVAQPVTPAPAPVEDPEKLQLLARLNALEARNQENEARQREADRRRAQEAAQREEAAFLAALQQEPDEATRIRKLAERRLNQANAIIAAQAQQIETKTKSEISAKEAGAKKMVALLTAQEHGIPAKYLPLLEKSETPEDLDTTVKMLSEILATGRAAAAEMQREQRIESGVDVAGGVNAGFVPPKMPKERSGDLAGLIAATQHELIQVR